MYHPQFVVAGSFIPMLCPVDVGVLKEEVMVMLLPVDSRMVSSCPTVDLDSTCGAEYEVSPFWLVVIGLSFPFSMYGCLGFLMYFSF